MLAQISRNLAEHIRKANSSISVDGSDAATAKQYPPAWSGSVAGVNDSLKGSLLLTGAGRYLATPNDVAVEDDRTPKILLKAGKAKDPEKRTREWAEAHLAQFIPGLLLPAGAAGRPDLKVSVVGARHVPVELELAPGDSIERLQLSVAGGVPRIDTIDNILNLIGMQSAWRPWKGGTLEIPTNPLLPVPTLAAARALAVPTAAITGADHTSFMTTAILRSFLLVNAAGETPCPTMAKFLCSWAAMDAATPMLTQAIAAAQSNAPPAGSPDPLLGVRTAIRNLFSATREALLATPSDVVSRVGQQAKSLSDSGLLNDPGVVGMLLAEALAEAHTSPPPPLPSASPPRRPPPGPAGDTSGLTPKSAKIRKLELLLAEQTSSASTSTATHPPHTTPPMAQPPIPPQAYAAASQPQLTPHHHITDPDVFPLTVTGASHRAMVDELGGQRLLDALSTRIRGSPSFAVLDSGSGAGAVETALADVHTLIYRLAPYAPSLNFQSPPADWAEAARRLHYLFTVADAHPAVASGKSQPQNSTSAHPTPGGMDRLPSTATTSVSQISENKPSDYVVRRAVPAGMLTTLTSNAMARAGLALETGRTHDPVADANRVAAGLDVAAAQAFIRSSGRSVEKLHGEIPTILCSARADLLSMIQSDLRALVGESRAAEHISEIRALALDILCLDLQHKRTVKLLGGEAPGTSWRNDHGGGDPKGTWGSTTGPQRNTDLRKAMSALEPILSRVWYLSTNRPIPPEGLGLPTLARSCVGLADESVMTAFEDLFRVLSSDAMNMRQSATAPMPDIATRVHEAMTKAVESVRRNEAARTAALEAVGGGERGTKRNRDGATRDRTPAAPDKGAKRKANEKPKEGDTSSSARPSKPAESTSTGKTPGEKKRIQQALERGGVHKFIDREGGGAVELLQRLHEATVGAEATPCGFTALGFECRTAKKGQCRRCEKKNSADPDLCRKVFRACTPTLQGHIRRQKAGWLPAEDTADSSAADDDEARD